MVVFLVLKRQKYKKTLNRPFFYQVLYTIANTFVCNTHKQPSPLWKVQKRGWQLWVECRIIVYTLLIALGTIR